MSNKSAFSRNLNSLVRIRPLFYYSLYKSYIDDEWLITLIDKEKFVLSNLNNGYRISLAHDSRIEWNDDVSKFDGFKRGFITLKGQGSLVFNGSVHTFEYEPLSHELRMTALQRRASERPT